MRDTPLDFERLMQRRIMKKTAVERLAMGCDMHDAAKELVRASMPELTGVRLKIAVFERFYGHDFDEETRYKIKEHLIRYCA